MNTREMIEDSEDRDDYLYFLETTDGRVHVLSWYGLTYTFQVGDMSKVNDTWRERKDER